MYQGGWPYRVHLPPHQQPVVYDVLVCTVLYNTATRAPHTPLQMKQQITQLLTQA